MEYEENFFKTNLENNVSFINIMCIIIKYYHTKGIQIVQKDHLAYGCMLPADLILVLIALGTLPPDAKREKEKL